MRYMNHIELREDMAKQEKERKQLAAKVRKLEAENKRLRNALVPMTKGTYWISTVDVKRARKALGLEVPNVELTGSGTESG